MLLVHHPHFTFSSIQIKRCVIAHITQFHKLLSGKMEIDTSLEKFAKRKSFDLNIIDVVLQENGVAYEIESDDLLQIHKEMQKDLAKFLIGNDQKKLWPHITIKSKVTAYKALKTHARLLFTFEPINFTAIGLSCWYYVKSYWHKKAEYLFQ